MGNAAGFTTINTEILPPPNPPTPVIKQRAIISLDISLPHNSTLGQNAIDISKQKIEQILNLGGHAIEP